MLLKEHIIKTIIFFSYILLALFLVVNVNILVRVLADSTSWSRSDYLASTIGASILADGRGAELYNKELQIEYYDKLLEGYDRHEAFNVEGGVKLLPYRFIPAVAVFLTPLNMLEHVQGYQVYLFLNTVLVLLAIYLLKVPNYLKNIFLVFSFVPFLVSITMAQPLSIMMLAFSLYYYHLIKDNDLLSGVFLGFLVLKPQYLVVVPFLYLLAKEKRQYIFGVFITVMAALITSVLVVGVDFPAKYLTFLFSTESATYGTHPQLIWSLTPLLKVVLGANRGTLFIANFLLGLGSFLVLIKLRVTSAIRREYVLLGAVINGIVFSYHSYHYYDLVLLFLPLLLLLHKLDELKNSQSLHLLSGFSVFNIGAAFITNFTHTRIDAGVYNSLLGLLLLCIYYFLPRLYLNKKFVTP